MMLEKVLQCEAAMKRLELDFKAEEKVAQAQIERLRKRVHQVESVGEESREDLLRIRQHNTTIEHKLLAETQSLSIAKRRLERMSVKNASLSVGITTRDLRIEVLEKKVRMMTCCGAPPQDPKDPSAPLLLSAEKEPSPMVGSFPEGGESPNLTFFAQRSVPLGGGSSWGQRRTLDPFVERVISDERLALLRQELKIRDARIQRLEESLEEIKARVLRRKRS